MTPPLHATPPQELFFALLVFMVNSFDNCDAHYVMANCGISVTVFPVIL